MAEYAGRLRIEWPATPAAALPALNPCMCRLTNVDTSEELFSVTRMVIDADCNAGGIVAELTMVADSTGRWPRPGELISDDFFDENRNLRTTTHRWLVAEMRPQA
jgi:hypothetical protein